MNKIASIIVIAGILISELILMWNQTAGFVFYSILIGIILISMERDNYVNKSDVLLIFLMIVPIARIASLFINFGLLWNVLIFYSIVAFLALYYANRLKIKSRHESWEESWEKSEGIEMGDLSYTLFAVLIGIALTLGSKFIFHMKNPAIIFIIVFIAYTEEILFRGEIQNLSRERYGAFYSILFTSLIYGIFSIGYGFPIFVFGFIASLILCLIYYRTKNIYLTFFWNIIFHSAFFGFYLIHLI